MEIWRDVHRLSVCLNNCKYSALGSGGWLKSPVLWDPGW